ncbi:MAG: nucleotidyl transferase AbiEii/AbiGii toxin family protein [Candidatus ainarchaeum sp.]|nr:nucleotidyl transferase AbiEii/AbiGii toxin family protein [Candidatus ainarchaeum sp.]
MINRNKLAELAKLYNLRPWQQEKHYIQTLILASLAERPLVFKGGTYLWFFHGLNRFSEDLDFTATGPFPKSFAQGVSASLALFGVENTLKPISDDDRSLSFRISAKGPLNSGPRDLCHVYVEISRRERVLSPTVSITLSPDPYGTPAKILRGMSLEEVAAEKVRAILTRRKARDAFDLAYLIGRKRAAFNPEIIREKLEWYKLPFSTAALSSSLKITGKQWKKELGPIVFGKLPEFSECADQILSWAGRQQPPPGKPAMTPNPAGSGTPFP